ncbi:MAG: hypothetical protein CVT83_00085 [Alphaproteobacteria bacterium HGW-Alphaproteobacteria-5]|nr:MAG: hypothetical protein CVT83_00085 [Alphaproteobacteria bacterium HGW-Alphaproteobacteria-5]
MNNQAARIRPIVRSRLYEAVVTLLQKQILSRAIAPGSKLATERELAESLKVNRATIREALRKLESLDLVEIRHGDGVFAKDFMESRNLELIMIAINLDERHATVLDVVEGRSFLVPEIAFLAAQRRTASELRELKKIVFNESLPMQERDIKLHQMIARCAHNFLYTITLNFFTGIFAEFGDSYFADEGNVRRSQQFHLDIFEAIKAQNPDQARQIMFDVLHHAGEIMKGELTKKPLKR